MDVIVTSALVLFIQIGTSDPPHNDPITMINILDVSLLFVRPSLSALLPFLGVMTILVMVVPFLACGFIFLSTQGPGEHGACRLQGSQYHSPATFFSRCFL